MTGLPKAWARAVRVDVTVIIIHSGNYELICLRHRASQTLYVSDLIEPSTCTDPGYGKLQVGIYVAAVQDAIARRREQPDTSSQTESPDNDGDDSVSGDSDRDPRGGRKGSHGQSWVKNRGGHRGNLCGGGHGLRGRGRFQGGAEENDHNVGMLKAIEVANKRNLALLYLRYDIYDSPTPASFLRCAPPIIGDAGFPTPPLPSGATSTYRFDECLPIVLTSEIGQGATSVVHRGMLELQVADGFAPLDVVVKLAFDAEQQDDLNAEYEMYRLLRSKGVLRGIPIALGIFDDCEDGPRALVMLYSGISLNKEPEAILPISDRKAALSTLTSIHRAGILHGDIREENILVSDSDVTIIDFAHSSQCDDQKAMDREYHLLRYILGLEEDSNSE